jgi:hypothetical protein
MRADVLKELQVHLRAWFMASSWLKPPTYQRNSIGGGRIRTTSKAEGEEKAGCKHEVRGK